MGLLTSWSARAKKVLLDGRLGLEDDGRGADGDRASDAPLGSLGGSFRRERGSVPDMDAGHDMASRMTWDAICRSDQFRGRWVALDEARYDEETGRATEGSVVDVDDDLVELCARIRESERKNCAILFCGEDGAQSPRH